MELKTLRKEYALPPRRQLASQVILACVAMASGLAAVPALAQQTVEEVIVTARKQEEKMLDVPMSIVAVSEKEIRAAATYDLLDLKATSGFQFNQYNGTFASGRTAGTLVFRGLQGETALPRDASGSLFIDGIYVSTGQASVNTVDVQRIEVLKGPQNAFFGRSTFGGAVNFITKNPANQFEGKLNATVTARGSSDIDATFEGPLVENVLKGRLTLVDHNKAAYKKASDGGDLGAEKTKSITGTLYATPTDSLWLRARAHYQQDDDSLPAAGYIAAGNNTSCNGVFYQGRNLSGVPISFTPGTPYFCGSIPKMDQFPAGGVDANTIVRPALRNALNNSVNSRLLGDTPVLDHMGLRRDALRLSFQAGYELPNKAELVFNIGYNKTESTSAWDLDKTTVENFYNISPIIARDLTIDARLSSDKRQSLRGLIGMSRYTGRYQYAQIDWNLYANAPAAAVSPTAYQDRKAEVPAIYGSVEYDVLSNLTLSADVRFQKDKVTATNYTETAVYTSEVKNTLPRLTATFKPIQDTSIYASLSEGVQPLDLNSAFLSATTAGKAYLASIVSGASEFTEQPKITSFELGIKQRLLNGKLQYALSFYEQKWKNRYTQTTIFNPPACVASGTGLTAACPLGVNGSAWIYANDATMKGIEFSADAALATNWTMGGTFDYKNPKWDKYYYGSQSSATGVGLLAATAYYFDGNTLGRIPLLTGSLNSTYRMPSLIAGWSSSIRGDVTYTGKAWDSDYNFVKTNDFYRVNLRFAVEKKDTKLELFVKNLFDDKNWDYAYRSPNLGLSPLTTFSKQGMAVQPPDRREVGIRASFGF